MVNEFWLQHATLIKIIIGILAVCSQNEQKAVYNFIKWIFNYAL